MKYKLNDNVYLEKICGEYVLIAASKERAGFRYFSRISRAAAFVLKYVIKGLDTEGIYAAIGENSDDRIRAGVDKILSELLANELIIPID